MHRFLRSTLLAALGLLITVPFQPAHAQFGRLKNKLKDKVEERVERRVDETADKAADKMLDKVDAKAEAALDRTLRLEGYDGARDASPALGGLQRQMYSLYGGAAPAVDPVAFQTLKELLPAQVGGRTQTDASGQKSIAMGIAMSSATGTYGDGDATIAVTDMGSLSGAAMFGYTWLLADVYVESDEGYQKTVEFEGFPALETFENADPPNAALQVVVGDRFIIAAEGRGLGVDALKAAVGGMDLARLDAMKHDGMSPEMADSLRAQQAELQAATQAYTAQAQEANATVETTASSALKALLPASVLGLPRGNASAQRSTVMGISTASAEADYGDGARSVDVSIIDMGTLSGMTMFGYGWLVQEYESETDTGFERTTQVGGHPAFERYDRSGGQEEAEVQVAVGDRFVVSVSGTGVSLDDVKQALGEIDLAQVAALK